MILKLISVIDMMIINQERSHDMSRHMRRRQAMASLESSPPIWSLSFSRYIGQKCRPLWWWWSSLRTMMMVRLFPQGLGADSLFEDPDFPADRYIFSGATGCQRRGGGHWGSAIKANVRKRKVPQLDTPEDMSCPMTWWHGKWQGNLSQTFQRCIVLHKPNSRGAGTFLMETTSSTGWKISLSFTLTLSSILSTSENILKFCDVQATKSHLLNWTQLRNCRCKCEDPIWCSQISNWIRLKTELPSELENHMSIKWFERSKLIPRWTIPGYLWTGPAGETLSRCFHKSTILGFLIQHKLTVIKKIT